MIIKVYAWIPRSYVHLAEIADKARKGLSINISRIEYKDYVSFTINNFEEYKNISFVADGDGLYSVSIKLPDNNPEIKAKEFYNTAKKLIMNKLIKELHKVTYTQIIEGILPITFNTVIFNNKNKEIKGFIKKKAGNLTIYLKEEEGYMKDNFIFINGKPNKNNEIIMDYYAFTNNLSRFFYEMMNKMEEYHNGTKEVIRLLEYEPNNKKINNAYLNLDLVKKDASESWAKVEQAIDCLIRKNKEFNSIKNNTLINTLGINNKFIKLEADKNYILSLWSLLINHLEYVDTAVEARVNFKNIESNNNNKWLGIINTAFILSTILIGLFITNTGKLNNVYTLTIVIVIWIIIYETISYLITKR